MKRPNFFIIGAPKCGTSTLINELRWHKQIYVPLAFEPQYFCTDFSEDARKDTAAHGDSGLAGMDEAHYMSLFEDVKDQHLAVGEKSVIYLYSEVAVDNILKFDPNAKLIVMLRNPIDLVYSWHSQLHYSFIEDVEDFETAWNLQDSRQQGKNISKYCVLPLSLQYKEIGSLGKYLQKLYTKIPRERVHVIFMEDFHTDPDQIYADTLEFLNVKPAPRPDKRKMNANKRYRFRWLGEILAHSSRSPWHRPLDKLLNLPLIRKLPLRHRLHEWNKVHYKRPPLSPDIRARLIEEFRDDVNLLAELTGRDLDHWLQPRK
jgi:hypothetical protein